MFDLCVWWDFPNRIDLRGLTVAAREQRHRNSQLKQTRKGGMEYIHRCFRQYNYFNCPENRCNLHATNMLWRCVMFEVNHSARLMAGCTLVFSHSRSSGPMRNGVVDAIHRIRTIRNQRHHRGACHSNQSTSSSAHCGPFLQIVPMSSSGPASRW